MYIKPTQDILNRNFPLNVFNGYPAFNSTHFSCLYSTCVCMCVSVCLSVCLYITLDNSATNIIAKLFCRSVHLHSAAYPQLHVSTQPGPNGKVTRAMLYE